jgi:hypothetical protein
VPTAASPPAIPFTVHSAAVSELPVTVAVYCAEAPSLTVVAPLNDRVMGEPDPFPEVPAGATNVTPRLCETDGSATLVAAIVTWGAAGDFVGAA